MTARDIAEWAGFQLVWLICALGAAYGDGRPGVVAALAFALAAVGARGWPASMVVVVAASTAAGALAESALVALDLVRHTAAGPLPAIAPAWIVALWLAFGVTVGSLARLIASRPVIVQAIIGLAFGPLAYWAGARLGALTLTDPKLLALSAAGLVWAVALPALITLHSRVEFTSR